MAADARTATDDRRTSLEAVRIALLIVIVVLTVLVGSAFMATPVKAGVQLAAAIAGLAGAISAYRAVGRRRRWPAWYAVAVLLVWVAVEASRVIFPSQPGQLVIPLGAFVVGTVLLWLRSIWPTVLGTLADAKPLRPGATAALAVSIAAPILAPGIALTDPTQVSPDDLAIRLEVACESPPAESTSYGVTATATFTWARQDVLPRGLAGLVMEPRERDAILASAVWAGGGPEVDDGTISWSMTESPSTEPWLSAGFLWGPPADALVTLAGGPPDDRTAETFADLASGDFKASVFPERMPVGESFRATWRFEERGPIPWPAVRLRYVHDYRFAIEAIAGCGEAVDGHRAS